MEGVWGLLGLPAPAYAPSRRRTETLPEEEDLTQHNGEEQPPKLDDSLTSHLLEENTLWMLRTMYECIEMSPNGKYFLTPPHKLPPWGEARKARTEAEELLLRARVSQQVSQATEAKRAAQEAQADVLALFGSAGLHEESILRAMEEDQRKARRKTLKMRRKEHVALFKDALRQRITTAGRAFGQDMADDLHILDHAFASDAQLLLEGSTSTSTSTSTSRAVSVDAMLPLVSADVPPEMVTLEEAVSSGDLPEAVTDTLVQQEDTVVTSKGAEGPESEEDVEVEAHTSHQKLLRALEKGKKKKDDDEDWGGAFEAMLRAAHRDEFDERQVLREHERRQTRFKSELARQMESLEHQTDEMRRELVGVQGYAPFCSACFRPVIAPCLCRLDADAADATGDAP